MSGILATLSSPLAHGTTMGFLLGPCFTWLIHRIICVIELRIILRSLPRADRAAAAVAYVSAYRPRPTFPATIPGKDSSRPPSD